MVFTVVISLIISRDRLSQGKIYQPSQHHVQIFTNSCWNSWLSVISGDICSAPCSGRGGWQEILSLLSFSTYFAYLAPGLIYYVHPKRTGEDRGNTLISLETAGSYSRKKQGTRIGQERRTRETKTAWVVSGGGWKNLQRGMEGSYLACRRLRVGKTSLSCSTPVTHLGSFLSCTALHWLASSDPSWVRRRQRLSLG